MSSYYYKICLDEVRKNMKTLIRIAVLVVGIGTASYRIKISIGNNLTTMIGVKIWMEPTVAISVTSPRLENYNLLAYSPA